MITIVLIGLIGGLITGISPCILPVLPVIFLSAGAQGARTTRTSPSQTSPSQATPTKTSPGADGRRPYLVVAGLTLSFSVFTLVGTLVLSALPLPQDIIRWAGLVVLILLGLGMIIPRVEHLLERPFSWIPQRRVGTDRGAFVLGLALGAVYVPCAGPVLAAITIAGATGRIGVRTIVLTVSFAAGTALPLLFFALAGRGLAERLRTFRRHQRQIRVGAGVVVIGLAVALTFNVTDALQRDVPDYTSALNKHLTGGGSTIKVLNQSNNSTSKDGADSTSTGSASAGSTSPGSANSASPSKDAPAPAGSKAQQQALANCQQEAGLSSNLDHCGAAPEITGIQKWLNTPGGTPLSLASLRGKVVLVDFWAYSCINCQRAIAHVDAWYSAYRAAGFEVIGVHTPEYAFEHVPNNVAAGARRLGITYPVALDNDYATWNNYQNQSWPADYLIDAQGEIRFVSVGEGDYPGTESLIRKLLTAAQPAVALNGQTKVADTTPRNQAQTPETYLGSSRAQLYAGNTALKNGTRHYSYRSSLPQDTFDLAGTWKVGREALTAGHNAQIALNYLAADVYLDVGGTGTLTVTVDGSTTLHQVSGAPDIYTVLHRTRQQRGILKVTLSAGLSAYSFTFG